MHCKAKTRKTMSQTTRQFLAAAAPTREMIDRFLDEDAHNWATFDPELGYTLKTCTLRDGIDGSYTLGHYRPGGERQMVNYAQRPCRINTYGDSFTQCHQVSDGETWQEYIAAHLGEPLRNFGVGGYGVYQAYRRMLRQEAQNGAEYIVLNIWSDDHYRSIYRWRWLHIDSFRQRFLDTGDNEAYMFHANPWVYLRLDVQSGQFEEHKNPYSTPESLYQLCDAEHVYETFKDDFAVQALLAQRQVTDVDTAILQEVAVALEVPHDFSSPQATATTATAALRRYALRSSMFITAKARAFAQEEDRELLLLLSYSGRDVVAACGDELRFDSEFVDYLDNEDFLYVDGLRKHVEDFATFNGAPADYVQRYYNGHYSPQGNHFFAFAVKDEVVDWLEPKPPAYREGGPSIRRAAAELA